MNLDTIVDTSNLTSFKDVEVSTATIHDTCPNENFTKSQQVLFNDNAGVILCSLLSPHVYTFRNASYTKHALFRKEPSTLLLICLVLVFLARRKLRLQWAGVNETYCTGRRAKESNFLQPPGRGKTWYRRPEIHCMCFDLSTTVCCLPPLISRTR